MKLESWMSFLQRARLIRSKLDQVDGIQERLVWEACDLPTTAALGDIRMVAGWSVGRNTEPAVMGWLANRELLKNL